MEQRWEWEQPLVSYYSNVGLYSAASLQYQLASTHVFDSLEPLPPADVEQFSAKEHRAQMVVGAV